MLGKILTWAEIRHALCFREFFLYPDVDKKKNCVFVMTDSKAIDLPADSMRVIGETIGIALSDQATKELAEDVNFRLKQIVQDALKFMYHGKRERLLPSDIDHALKAKNVEPIYGFDAVENIPFRFATGGGRELFFGEEKDIEIADLVNAPVPKVPADAQLKVHWLAIDGIQPSIPENPPPIGRDQQMHDAADPASKILGGGAAQPQPPQTGKMRKDLKTEETVKIKDLATHELSVEQQLYYKEITEACVGSDEARRTEALQSLSSDPGLHQMLPRLCTFIAEGVRVNVVQKNLALLIYLMRTCKALLDNSSLSLERYLHELIPAVSSCMVSKQLCNRPDVDNHWALRDFAAKLLAQMCRTFHTSANLMQPRVTRMLTRALTSDATPLSGKYGATIGITELGADCVRNFLLPLVKMLGDKIRVILETAANSNLHPYSSGQTAASSADKVAAEHIRTLVVKACTPVLKAQRPAPDVLDEYRADFGWFGPALHMHVCRARAVTPAAAAAAAARGQRIPPGVPLGPRSVTVPVMRTPQPSSPMFNPDNRALRMILQSSQTGIPPCQPSGSSDRPSPGSSVTPSVPVVVQPAASSPSPCLSTDSNP